jgi:elongation factor Ts
MDISAAQVSALREKTGLGMMLCKKALTEAGGDMDKAIANLRKQGQATMQKRAGKAAKEGTLAIVANADTTVMYEVNSETDFVARNEDFIKFVEVLGELLLARKPASLEAAKALTADKFGGLTVEAKVLELTGKIGEIISFRRLHVETVNPARERVLSYLHGKKFGVLVKLAADKATDSEAIRLLGKDLAMQVAAANPIAVDKDRVDADTLAREKEIYLTQAQNSGKPDKIWDKIVEGKLAKFFKESCLVEQEYIKDPTTSVTDRIAAAEKETGAKIGVVSFLRWELGAEE